MACTRFLATLMVLLTSMSVSGGLFAREVQRETLSVNSSYPITIQGTFIENYSGVIDIGIQYDRCIVNHLFGGVALNWSKHRMTELPINTTLDMLNPRFVLGYGIAMGSRIGFRSGVGIGYSILYFSNRDYDYHSTKYGLNLAPSLQVTHKVGDCLSLGLQCCYDCVFNIDLTKGVADTHYNRRIRLLNVGLVLELPL
jgi:hypothetical protein